MQAWCEKNWSLAGWIRYDAASHWAFPQNKVKPTFKKMAFQQGVQPVNKIPAVKWIVFTQFGAGLILLVETWIKVPPVAVSFDVLQLLAVNIRRGIERSAFDRHSSLSRSAGRWESHPHPWACDFGLEIIGQPGKWQMVQGAQKIRGYSRPPCGNVPGAVLQILNTGEPEAPGWVSVR